MPRTRTDDPWTLPRPTESNNNLYPTVDRFTTTTAGPFSYNLNVRFIIFILIGFRVEDYSSCDRAKIKRKFAVFDMFYDDMFVHIVNALLGPDVINLIIREWVFNEIRSYVLVTPVLIVFPSLCANIIYENNFGCYETTQSIPS